MKKLTELEIENLAIERLQALGFDYIYGPDIAPDSANPERESFAELLLLSRLHNAVGRINPTLPAAALDEAIKTIQRISSPELLANNKHFIVYLLREWMLAIKKMATPVAI